MCLTRYTDKRIQLRKNRYLAMQRMMEEKRLEVMMMMMLMMMIVMMVRLMMIVTTKNYLLSIDKHTYLF